MPDHIRPSKNACLMFSFISLPVQTASSAPQTMLLAAYLSMQGMACGHLELSRESTLHSAEQTLQVVERVKAQI